MEPHTATGINSIAATIASTFFPPPLPPSPALPRSPETGEPPTEGRTRAPEIRLQRLEQRAARHILFEYKLHRAYRKPLSLERAMQMADARMPHEDGRLYRCKPLTEPYRSWRDGAPVPGFKVYYQLGVSVALYMRMVRGGRNLFLPLFGISLVPLIYNLMGTKATADATINYVLHSLGNADEVSVLAHGVPDTIIVLLAMAALCYGAHTNRAVAAEICPLRPTNVKHLSARDYTVMIEGLPRDPVLSVESLVKGLRELLGSYGEVVCCSLARANREYLQLLRSRKDLKTTLLYLQIAAHRAPLRSKDLSARAKIESKLQGIDAKIEAYCKRPTHERAPCAGTGFVTFNYRADARTCSVDLRKNPRRTLQLQTNHGKTVDVHVLLKVSVPPHPSQVVWENLQFTSGTRFFRRLVVNAILLLQCGLSTYVIVKVTHLNVADTLGEYSSSTQQMGTTAWTTLVIILSNLLIFMTAPVYAEFFERDIRTDHRETMLAMKLTFFQLGNAFAAALSFLWTKKGGASGVFDRAWYEQGGATTVLSMVLADIFFINPFVEGMRIFDVLIAKALLAPRALAQQQMNSYFAAENPLYLPFRMQLLLKQLVYGIAWSYAFPVFYLLILCFLAVSVVVDESGLLRTFKGLVTSSDKMYDAAVTQVLPAALVLHCLLAFFTAAHMEMENRWLVDTTNSTNKQHTMLNGPEALGITLRNPAVALALATVVISVTFSLVFITVFKLSRQRLHSQHKNSSESSIKGVHASLDVEDMPFRNIDHAGANPQLYVPPLTMLLLANWRDRTASLSYDQELRV